MQSGLWLVSSRVSVLASVAASGTCMSLEAKASLPARLLQLPLPV